MNLAMLVEPGASLETGFLQWWRRHAPPAFANDETMRELAAAAFAAGQNTTLPEADEVRELKEALRNAKWALSEVSL